MGNFVEIDQLFDIFENPTVLSLPDFKNFEARVVLPQFAHDPYFGVEFWVNTCGNEWSPVFIAGWRNGGRLAGGREGESG